MNGVSKTEDFQYPLVKRENIEANPYDEILICSAKPSSKTKDDDLPFGERFLKKYDAWGFQWVQKKVPFFALYMSYPESRIKYFAKIKGIYEPDFMDPPIKRHYEYSNYKDGKRVIKLKNIRKLKDHIIYKKLPIQGKMHVCMDTFKEAKTTLDLFNSQK